MHKILLQLVEKTVAAAHLSEEESVDLREELISHIEAHSYELQLAGFSEEKIVQEILRIFGHSDEIGKQLYITHRQFESIPLIGELLYYLPIIGAGKLFLINLAEVILLLASTAGMLIFTRLLFMLSWEYYFYAIAFFIYGGYWLAKHSKNVAQAVESIVIAMLPIVLFMLPRIAREFVSINNLDTENDIIYYLLVCIVIGNCIGLCFGSIHKKYKMRRLKSNK